MKYQIVFGLKFPNYLSERDPPSIFYFRSACPALPCSTPHNWPPYAAFVILARLPEKLLKIQCKKKARNEDEFDKKKN